MRSFPGTAPRLIAATIILAGCAPGPGNPATHAAPTSPIPTVWAADPCVVVDTTAPTADTLAIGGIEPPDAGAPATSAHCGAARVPVGVAPPVIIWNGPIAFIDCRREGLICDSFGAPPFDVMVMSDEKALADFRASGRFLIAPLPWNATYVLVSSHANAAVATPPLTERDALARDAVTVDARGAAVPFPWLTDSACAAIPTGPVTASRLLIAYPEHDSTARQLAERIVSLAGANGGTLWISSTLGDRVPASKLRTAAFPADSIPHALATGRAVAAVLPIARDPLTACFTNGNARVPAGAVPLVDVRAHVVVRRGSGAAFVINPNGSLGFFRRAVP